MRALYEANQKEGLGLEIYSRVKNKTQTPWMTSVPPLPIIQGVNASLPHNIIGRIRALMVYKVL